MISIIMPYWRRAKLLKRSLEHLADLYHAFNMEIVIVDDGCGDLTDFKFAYPFQIKLIHLPHKEEALNPCVPINAGVKLSEGYIIVLTNPETTHSTPILEEMLDDLTTFGPKAYIIASCWSTDHNRWYCHSSVTQKKNALLGRLPLPKGTGLHFCTMMYKKFFNEIGGFDEAYREGQGVEDNDFLWTLKKNDAHFIMKDDLVVFHESTPTSWPEGGIERNTEIYRKKWKDVPGAF